MYDYISYQFGFDFAAVLICMGCLFFTFVMGRTDRRQNKFYIMLLGIVMLNAVTEVVCSRAIPRVEKDIWYTCYRVCHYIYFLTHSAIPVIVCFYMMSVTGKMKLDGKFMNMLFVLPFVFTEILVVFNPLTFWVYTYSDRHFVRSWGENLIYVQSAFYMLFAMLHLLRVWNAMTQRRKFTILYFFLMSIAGVVIQAVFAKMKVEILCESLGFLGVMLAIEDEDDRVDSDIDIHNRKALGMDINSYLAVRQRFHVICIKITNADIIERVTSSANTGIIAESVGEYLKTVVSRHNIYRTSYNTFLMTVVSDDDRRAHDIAEEVSNRFKNEGFALYDKEVVYFNAVVMLAQIGKDISTSKDVFYLVDSPVPKGITKKILEGEDLGYLIRRVAIENAVNRGLEDHNFEVYYQPTYYLKGLKIHGAEALIRLHDPELGLVLPDDFIPVAEQLDHIDEIDDFVLKNVCEFLKSGIPAAHGIETINVNLSVIECMRPGFVAHISGIVEEYDVDKKNITFEITESAQARDYELLKQVVKELRKKGFHVAMDDYGTGYSNMQNSFSLDFDLIKIDKSILWGAEKTELGEIILENSVRMIKQMKKKILVEGVETGTQIDLLDRQGVDYLQGFYFSKPVNKEEFLRVIEKNEE